MGDTSDRGFLDAVRSGMPQVPAQSDQSFIEDVRRQQMTHSGSSIGQQSPEQFLAGQVGQLRLGEPGLDDFKIRADISLSDSIEEKAAKFKANFPDGDFVEVRQPTDPNKVFPLGGTTYLFRRNQSEPFAKFDADAFEKFELWMDIADFTGDVPSIVMETMITRGGTLIQTLGRLFLGGATGEVVKEAVEDWRGFSSETAGQVTSRALTTGAASAVGGAATVAVSGPINILRGRANIGIVPGAPSAVAAARRLGVKGLLPGQISTSPILRKLQGQSGATGSTVGNYMREQNEGAIRALLRLDDQYLPDLLADNLEKLSKEAKRQIVDTIKKRPMDLSETGSAIQHGISEYDDLTTALINRAYANARALETPEFDISPAVEVANKIQVGVRGVVAGEETRLNPLDRQLADVVGIIKELDPSLPDVGAGSATDQLRALRSTLYDLKTPDPGTIARQPQKDAARLYAAITKVLKDPRNTSPEFRAAWDRANSMASDRFDTFDKLIIVKAVQNETPAMMANRLAQPLQVDNLKVLRETIPAPRWNEFREGVKADFLSVRNVDELTSRLQNFDQPTLNELFSAQDQVILKGIGKSIDRFNRLNIGKILEQQRSRANVVRTLMDKGDAGTLDAFMKSIPADPNAPVRRQLRAGLIEDAIQSVTTVAGNRLVINPKALASYIDKLKKTGAERLLTTEDKRVLIDLDQVMQFIPDVSDSGTSLIAGQVVSEVKKGKLDAILTLVHYAGIGRILTSKTAQRVLIGAGRSQPMDFTNLRIFGGVLGTVASDFEQESQPAQ